MKKKFMVLFIVCVMTIGVVACSRNGGDSSSPSSDASQKTSSVESTASSELVDIWAPYNDAVTLTVGIPQNAGITFPEGQDYDKNIWYTMFKDEFNIQLENLWVSANHSTQVNLAMASDSLPDVFSTDGATLELLVAGGLVADITEIYDTYASEQIKSFQEMDDTIFQTAVYDGKLYGIPKLSCGLIDQPNHVWIRKDWKESLNLSDPETIDDLINIAKLFMEEYGGYGIGETQDLYTFNILAPAWGAYPKIWVETADGTLGYGSIQPEMKEALTAFAQWYKDGILDPDFAISNMAKMFEANINGEIGIQPHGRGGWGYYPGVDVVSNLGEEAIFQAYGIPSANGETVKAPVNFANNGYIVISKNCKNPEAVIKLVNYYIKMLTTKDPADAELILELFSNGLPNIVHSIYMDNPVSDYNQYVDISAALESGDTSTLGTSLSKYNDIVDYMTNATPKAVGNYLQQGDPKSAYSVSKKILDDNNIIKNEMWGLPTETIANSGSTLDDILIQGFTQIIVGDQPVDYFDILIESWKSAGGDQATAEINETYGN